jgi:hypothetical protein
MRILRVALMLLAVMLLIGAGTPNPSGQNGAQTKVNRAEPPCPPICPN